MPLSKWRFQILANSATPQVVFLFSPTYAASSPLSAAGHRPALVTAPVIFCWATLLGALPPKGQHQLIYAVFVSPAVLPCLPLHTTPLITCRLRIMRTLVTLKILANWGFLSWESLVGACLRIAIKKNSGEKLFLFQVCLASLRKKKTHYRPLLMCEVAWAECLHFSSSCDLTISSNLKTLIQTIFVTLTILTKTCDITLSIGVKKLSLFSTHSIELLH